MTTTTTTTIKTKSNWSCTPNQANLNGHSSPMSTLTARKSKWKLILALQYLWSQKEFGDAWRDQNLTKWTPVWSLTRVHYWKSKASLKQKLEPKELRKSCKCWWSKEPVQLYLVEIGWENYISTGKKFINVKAYLPSDIKKVFRELFKPGLGKYNGGKVHLDLKEGAQPVFRRARNVPYSVKDEGTAIIKRNEASEGLVPITHSQWASPVVYAVKPPPPPGTVHRPGNKYHLCGDF